MDRNQTINICHLMSGDLWAGAEVHLSVLAPLLHRDPRFQLLVVLLNDGRLAGTLREAGLEVVVLDENKYGFYELKRRLTGLLSARNIDILHSHRYKENLLAVKVRKPCGIGHLVQTIHGLPERFSGFKALKAGVHNFLNRHVSGRHFDRVIAVSDDIRRRLIDQFRAEQLTMIHNAIDIPEAPGSDVQLALWDEFGISPDNLVIGTAGRLVPVKGYDMLLKAAVPIIRSRPDVRILIAGDGPLKTQLDKQMTELGLGGHVRFVGFRDDVTAFISCVDVFVMPSYHEGIPMVLLEAMALKKPVVCTAVGGMVEVVEDRHSGVLVGAGDENAFATACLEVLDNAGLRVSLGTDARLRIEAEFSSRTLADKTAELYEELMA